MVKDYMFYLYFSFEHSKVAALEWYEPIRDIDKRRYKLIGEINPISLHNLDLIGKMKRVPMIAYENIEGERLVYLISAPRRNIHVLYHAQNNEFKFTLEKLRRLPKTHKDIREAELNMDKIGRLNLGGLKLAKMSVFDIYFFSSNFVKNVAQERLFREDSKKSRVRTIDEEPLFDKGLMRDVGNLLNETNSVE